jgi:hypothetical protein
MAFKTLFMAHAPDAEREKHRSIIDTGKYQLFTVIVKNQDEAISVAKEMYDRESIHSIILCPGFTHTDVSGIFQALQGKVGVSVARGDGPGSKITQPVLQKEFGA